MIPIAYKITDFSLNLLHSTTLLYDKNFARIVGLSSVGLILSDDICSLICDGIMKSIPAAVL